MKTRVLSGLIMLPLLVVVILNGYVLYGAALIIALMAVKEFYSGFKAMDIHACYPIGVVAAICLFAIGLGGDLMKLKGEEILQLYMLWFFGCVLASLLYLFKINDRKLEDAMATIIGIFYVVFFCYHIGLIAQSDQFSIMVWFVILSAFGTDIMAYFSGYLFGKHKLCPNISPKKTIEGSIGGTLGSIVLCTAFGLIFMADFTLPGCNVIHFIIIGFLGGIISQFGDLTASVFKRKMGIKDYGNLIPGHGGILDRFDSVLFTGPMVYYYIQMAL